MGNDLYSVEQVAERLGLHVRTVRNYVRDGRLKAVKIGKQYRITRADLEAMTGEIPPAGRAEVSSIVQVDGLSRASADRLGILLTAGANGPRDSSEQLQIQVIYDESRSRMKIVILGDPAATAEILQLLDGLLGPDNGLFG